MRRSTLPPPRLVPQVALDADAGWEDPQAWQPATSPVPTTPPAAEEPRVDRIARDRLREPSPASDRSRHLFHPRRGWVRRFERGLSHALSRHVYPRIPWLRVPYDRQLERGLTLSEATLRLRGLPPAFAGTRVLLITDVHAGPFVSPRVLDATFARLTGVRPDLILLGGDLATARYEELAESLEAFDRLRAPLGVFAVLGNHDHYTDEPDRIIRTLEQRGIAVLDNRAVSLTRGDARLTLAGVDDLLMGRPDLPRALVGARPPVILLSHNPDLLFEAAREGVALMLSGHTHGGQVRIPRLPVLVRQSRYRLDEGRYRYGDTELVVSRGLGVVGVPWRNACAPEAVLLELEPAP